MPSQKTVKSLQLLCLTTITKHYKKGLNPFATMPNRILDKVLNHPEYLNNVSSDHRNWVTKQYCDNLGVTINQFTTRLDFSEKPLLVVQRGVELICKIRPTIIHLNLSNTLIDVEHLKELARSIPNIQSLQLKSTMTTDEVLAILGQNCPDLRELDISNCEITDEGIEGLCKSEHRLIRKLFVIGSQITDNGAMKIMCTFQRLRYFDYPNILYAMEAMYKQSDLGINISEVQFQLETVSIYNRTDFPITNFTLDIATEWCPNVTDINIFTVNNTDDWLIKFAKFPKLNHLALMGLPTDNAATFPRNISPLLKTIGNNLESLFFYGIKDIDLWTIGRNCDQLTLLFLWRRNRYVSSIPFVNDFPRGVFSKLQNVAINCEESNDIPVDQLECLLSNCVDVDSLQLYDCQTLTDDVFTRVLKRNQFSKLLNFKITRCNNINMASLVSLVKSSKSLQELIYDGCTNIRPDDHNELQDLIRKENLDLVIPSDV